MKARTLIELLTLSSNLYVIAKDKEFFEKLKSYAEKGQEKYDEFMHEEGDEGDDLLHKLLHKAQEAKEELERKMEEVAVSVYKKMRIAHTDQVEALHTEIDLLRRQLNLAEARFNNSQIDKTQS